jgi:peptide/nickel transport system substrate-binding protein
MKGRTMSHSSRATAALVAAGLIFTATACSAGGSETDETPTTMRVAIDPPTTLDPQQATELPSFQAARLSYDTLVRVGDKGLVPGIASEWESTPTEAEFTLRDDATCADGTPITPTVVKGSLEAFAATGTPVINAVVFGGTTPTITADDTAGTVTVSLSGPWSDLVRGLSNAGTGIVCPAGLADPDALADGSAAGAQSGPYVMTASEPGVSYTFELRDDYTAWPEWDIELPGEAPQEIALRVTPDPSSAVNQLISGQLDAARVMPDSVARVENETNLTTSVNPFGTFYLAFNERPGLVFADEAARKAVAQAVDVAALNSAATDDTGWPINTFGTDTMPCVVDGPNASVIKRDLDSAKSVLDGLRVRLVGATIVGSNGAGNVYLAESLRALGADVELTNTDIGTYASQIYTQPESWDLTIFPDLNYLNSFSYFIAQFQGPAIEDGGVNFAHVDSAVAAENYQIAVASGDEAERCAAWNTAADALFAGAHAVPLFVEPFIWTQRADFQVLMLGGSLEDNLFRVL